MIVYTDWEEVQVSRRSKKSIEVGFLSTEYGHLSIITVSYQLIATSCQVNTDRKEEQVSRRSKKSRRESRHSSHIVFATHVRFLLRESECV